MGLIRLFLRKIQDFKIRRSGVIIGKDTMIQNNRNQYGSEPYLIRIGEHCTISSGVIFLTHDGATRVFRDNPAYSRGRRQVDMNKYGTIELKDNVFLGMNAIIMPDVTIGSNSIIGAGAVVRRSVPPNVVVAGNPARVVSTLEEYIEIFEKGTIPFPEHYKSKREVLQKHFWGK